MVPCSASVTSSAEAAIVASVSRLGWQPRPNQPGTLHQILPAHASGRLPDVLQEEKPSARLHDAGDLQQGCLRMGIVQKTRVATTVSKLAWGTAELGVGIDHPCPSRALVFEPVTHVGIRLREHQLGDRIWV